MSGTRLIILFFFFLSFQVVDFNREYRLKIKGMWLNAAKYAYQGQPGAPDQSPGSPKRIPDRLVFYKDSLASALVDNDTILQLYYYRINARELCLTDRKKRKLKACFEIYKLTADSLVLKLPKRPEFIKYIKERR